jgi:hypothetical protein
MLRKLFVQRILNVSPGSIIVHNERIAAHVCTTLSGFSGAPVMLISNPGVFVGLRNRFLLFSCSMFAIVV